ncbi:MAG: ORF6C domain-containing protein [Chloroflexi bacterium]|nr:ORF6C domain-containing protein [Chloroflexota bacterium]MCI0579873.1 ORF6C domain-containing protein [Chloroflexota bacterium]MCI0646154.1 ORF6C domain-containing protein [Chloroflexota bacterium]MCI0729864.1 ORF6C domain-containing protein [Chloroflexota bacterium]
MDDPNQQRALVPIEQREIGFYGDALTAVLSDDGTVYVPVRPICDYLGIAWNAQYERMKRDPVLSEVMMSVRVTRTDIDSGSKQPRTSQVVALPLDFVNGFLFGINASRVKQEARENLIRYQRECYRVLADAFLDRPLPTEPSPAMVSLAQIREMGLAIAEMAEQQMEFEQRIITTESRLNKAAVFMGEMGRRVTVLEQKLAPGNVITDAQAEEIQAAVHALGMLLTEHDKSKNHFQGIFNELHRRFGVTSYKLIPQGKYPAVLAFLQEWQERASR